MEELVTPAPRLHSTTVIWIILDWQGDPWDHRNNAIDADYNGVYVRCMHLITAINTLAFAIAAYLVIFRSPTTMKLYKWFLLNVMICSYISDTFQSVFYVPFMLAPMFGGCSLGLLRHLHNFGINLGIIPWSLTQEFLSITGMSLLTAITFRYVSLAGSGSATNYFTKPSVLLGIAFIHIFYGSPMLYWSIKLAPDSPDAVRDLIKEHFPETEQWYNENACYAFTTKYEEAFTYGLVALGQLTVAVGVAAVIVILTICKLRAQRHVMSARTYEMHKTLLKALVIQLFVPITFIFCSYFTLGFLTLVSVRAKFYPQYQCIVAFAVASLHSTANIMVMIYFTKPYKTALIEMCQQAFALVFGRFKNKASAIDILPSQYTDLSTPQTSDSSGLSSLDAIEERHQILVKISSVPMDT